jgi:hypothetical protein
VYLIAEILSFDRPACQRQVHTVPVRYTCVKFMKHRSNCLCRTPDEFALSKNLKSEIYPRLTDAACQWDRGQHRRHWHGGSASGGGKVVR